MGLDIHFHRWQNHDSGDVIHCLRPGVDSQQSYTLKQDCFTDSRKAVITIFFKPYLIFRTQFR